MKYQNAYDKVCNHRFITKLAETQNEQGYWPPVHGYTEAMLRKCLSYGLEKDHICLKQVADYYRKVLKHEETWDQSEKKDNVRWWPEMFVPLVSAAMLSLIDPSDPLLKQHRSRWGAFTELAFKNGEYDPIVNESSQSNYFGFHTKRYIPPFNYYNLLLLAPNQGNYYIKDSYEQTLIKWCLNKPDGMYYVYDKRPCDMMAIDIQDRNGRQFSSWIRCLSILAPYSGWTTFESKFSD